MRCINKLYLFSVNPTKMNTIIRSIMVMSNTRLPLYWHHIDVVSNHRRLDRLLNRLLRRRLKKTSTFRVAGLCGNNSPVNSPHKRPVMPKMFPFDNDITRALSLRTTLQLSRKWHNLETSLRPLGRCHMRNQSQKRYVAPYVEIYWGYWVCFIWQETDIVSSNRLAQNRRQAITWINGDPIRLTHMASLSTMSVCRGGGGGGGGGGPTVTSDE